MCVCMHTQIHLPMYMAAHTHMHTGAHVAGLSGTNPRMYVSMCVRIHTLIDAHTQCHTSPDCHEGKRDLL